MVLTLLRLDLAGSENKAHAEFLVGGGNEQENKVLLQWFKAFAECQLAISEARLIYVRTFPFWISCSLLALEPSSPKNQKNSLLASF